MLSGGTRVDKAMDFEKEAFAAADSWADYLKRVAGGLINVSHQVQIAAAQAAQMQAPVYAPVQFAMTSPVTPAGGAQSGVQDTPHQPQATINNVPQDQSAPEQILHMQQQRFLQEVPGQTPQNLYRRQ